MFLLRLKSTKSQKSSILASGHEDTPTLPRKSLVGSLLGSYTSGDDKETSRVSFVGTTGPLLSWKKEKASFMRNPTLSRPSSHLHLRNKKPENPSVNPPQHAHHHSETLVRPKSKSTPDLLSSRKRKTIGGGASLDLLLRQSGLSPSPAPASPASTSYPHLETLTSAFNQSPHGSLSSSTTLTPTPSHHAAPSFHGILKSAQKIASNDKNDREDHHLIKVSAKQVERHQRGSSFGSAFNDLRRLSAGSLAPKDPLQLTPSLSMTSTRSVSTFPLVNNPSPIPIPPTSPSPKAPRSLVPVFSTSSRSPSFTKVKPVSIDFQFALFENGMKTEDECSVPYPDLFDFDMYLDDYQSARISMTLTTFPEASGADGDIELNSESQSSSSNPLVECMVDVHPGKTQRLRIRRNLTKEHSHRTSKDFPRSIPNDPQRERRRPSRRVKATSEKHMSSKWTFDLSPSPTLRKQSSFPTQTPLSPTPPPEAGVADPLSRPLLQILRKDSESGLSTRSESSEKRRAVLFAPPVRPSRPPSLLTLEDFDAVF